MRFYISLCGEHTRSEGLTEDLRFNIQSQERLPCWIAIEAVETD